MMLFRTLAFFFLTLAFCNISHGNFCSESLEDLAVTAAGGKNFVSFKDLEIRHKEVFDGVDSEAWDQIFTRDFLLMQKVLSGFLQEPWSPEVLSRADPKMKRKATISVLTSKKGERILVRWGAPAALSNYAKYLRAHELTHPYIERKLHELNPSFPAVHRWVGSNNESPSDSIFKRRSREVKTLYSARTQKETLSAKSLEALFAVTSNSYEELIADIVPLLWLGGPDETWAHAIAEVRAIEALGISQAEYKEIEWGEFRASSRDLGSVLSAQEILGGMKGMGRKEVSEHQLIANARSRIWQKIKTLKTTLELPQIFSLLVKTLEHEVTHQLERGFYLSSDKLDTVRVEQVEALNQGFVERFEKLLNSAMTSPLGRQ